MGLDYCETVRQLRAILAVGVGLLYQVKGKGRGLAFLAGYHVGWVQDCVFICILFEMGGKLDFIRSKA